MHKIKFTITCILFVILQNTICMQAYSQNKEGNDPTGNPNTYKDYRLFSVSGAHPIYRDFATSPLFYRGGGFNLGNARLSRSDDRERLFQLSMGISPMFAHVPESDFIQPGSVAFFGNLEFHFHQLWKLKSLSSEKNNFKLGGALRSSQHIRINPSLQNNALGLENITNFMLASHIIRDISRVEARPLDLWLFQTTLRPIKRDLKFHFNAGILNFNYRPGYAYSYVSELEGLETNPLSWILDNYRWSLNGWRFTTELEYISYLPNGNAYSWAYVWDAAHAPGRYEAFQMANHEIKFTYYFHIPKL